jgi:flagellar basal body-associated protein FliL
MPTKFWLARRPSRTYQPKPESDGSFWVALILALIFLAVAMIAAWPG